ncbi:MAG TPA: hypothetical protein PK890_11890 [Terrimesophilobacter sp.]|nr:hypothetical protein [Terrimesophilobacter sp.]
MVEHAPTAVLFAEPRHPYTRGLLGALPTLESRGRRLSAAATHPWVEGHSDGSCGLDDCRLSVPANADSGHEWACFTAEAVSG